MPDICIFYSEPDQDKVEALSSILEGMGWSVWWDKDIKYGRWGPEIEKKIKLAKCVIPIWNSHAVRKGSVTFAEAEASRVMDKPMITLISEDIKPPFPFNAEHETANIKDWDGNPGTTCISDIVESVEAAIGIAPKKWKGERPEFVNLSGKKLKLPCFVKSLSTHETQLKPDAGLTVLNIFSDVDALLISAYDMYIDNNSSIEEKRTHRIMCKKLKELHKKGALIFLDSGNYEKSRKKDKSWNIKKFNWVLNNTPYDYAFCFDNYKPKLDIAKNVEDVLKRLKGKHEHKLLPILHAPLNKGGSPRFDLLPDIILEFARRHNSPIIAVPERELGEGIYKKAETVIKIREKLNSLGRYHSLHLLGTGNPLSLAILAAAGADLFDGLEWCRTVADKRTGFLFHHQQFDLFISQSVELAEKQIVKDAMNDDGISIYAKLGLHNLDFFYTWMDELQFHIHNSNVGSMISYKASFPTQDFVDEIKEHLPGLFS